MVGPQLLSGYQGRYLTWVCGGSLSLTNSDLILVMASSWELQAIVGRSWRAQVRTEIEWVIRSVIVRDGWCWIKARPWWCCP